MILERINEPNDIKKLTDKEYPILAEEIREFLIEKISNTGGHLASNLGVVELTMVLHLLFDLPKDKLIWDVGHQAYTHKLLTGRKSDFDELRKYGGLSGYPRRCESCCDAFGAGHSSTSISAGLGIAAARDIKGDDFSVVSVIGDGALTGGMAYEALNNAARQKSNFIIVLNDNNMSIAENVGGMSRYLGSMRTGQAYNDLKEHVVRLLSNVPGIGDSLINQIKKTKSGIKQLVIPGMLFEDMGITYLGPVDGHNFRQLFKVFSEAKKVNRTVLVHVITKKGKGYRPAEVCPTRFHGVDPFDIKTGKVKMKKTLPTYTDVFAKEIVSLGKKYPELITITAAMPDGTGLTKFAKEFPERFFDVGIAEAHGVTFAAGMAAIGMKPVVAVYSSFLQRAYDQILHDVCIQNLPVTFAIDRAGLVGSDGETHQGIFDLSYLSSIPAMTVFAPKNRAELQQALRFAVEFDGPLAIRYPRGTAFCGLSEFQTAIEFGKAEVLAAGETVAILAVGGMVAEGVKVCDELEKAGYTPTFVNARFVKPFDRSLLNQLLVNHRLIVTMEENVRIGGYGEMVSDYIHSQRKRIDTLVFALEDSYIEHGNVDLLKQVSGIDSASMTKRILEHLKDERIER